MAIHSLFRRHLPLRTSQQNKDTVATEEPTKEKEVARSSETGTPNETEGSGEIGKSKGTIEDQKEEISDARKSSRRSSTFKFPLSLLSRRKDPQDASEDKSATTPTNRRFSQSPIFSKSLKGPTSPPLASTVARKCPEGIVTIEVGPLLTKYYVHRDFLMHQSGYFRTALAGPWLEASSRLITLDDVEVPPFNVFIHWLYTQRIPANTAEWVRISEAKKWKIEVVELKVLVLADRFLMPAFRRAVNNDLVTSRLKHAPYYELVIHAFENLPEGSPILQLLVDTHCLHWEPKTDEGDEEEMQLRPDLPHEFLVKVMIRYAELKADKEGKLKKLVACNYHLHADDEEKEKCGK